MKAKHVGMVLVVLMLVGFIGFSATSYAGWGRGGSYCAGATKVTIFSCSTFFIRFVTSSFVKRFSPN